MYDILKLYLFTESEVGRVIFPIAKRGALSYYTTGGLPRFPMKLTGYICTRSEKCGRV